MKKINNGLYGIVLLLSISSSQAAMAYTCPTADEVIAASNLAVAEGRTEFTIHEPYGDFAPYPATKMQKNDIVFYQATVLHDKEKTTSLAQVGCSYYPADNSDPDHPTIGLIQKAASSDERVNFNGNNSSKWWNFGSEDANIYCNEYHAENCVFETASDK